MGEREGICMLLDVIKWKYTEGRQMGPKCEIEDIAVGRIAPMHSCIRLANMSQ